MFDGYISEMFCDERVGLLQVPVPLETPVLCFHANVLMSCFPFLT